MPIAPASKHVKSHSRHILGLDLIRFCSAMMVAIFHLAYWSWAPAESLTKSVSGGIVRFPGLSHVTWIGWVGVEIFFVLSGFVISYSAEGASASSFLRSRIVRLYPAAWISATATLSVTILAGHAGAGTALEYAKSMALWVDGPWIDGVYWTLGIEIMFYASILAVLCIAGSGAIPKLLETLAVWSSLFWFALAFDRICPRVLPLVHDVVASRWSVFLLLRHGCLFAVGGLLWLCLRKQCTAWRLLLIGVCLLAGFMEIINSARVDIEYVGDSYTRRAIAGAVWVAAIGAMVGSIHYDRLLLALLGRAARTIQLLGLMTYPIYLLHDVIGAVLLRQASLLGAPPLAALTCAMLAILGGSWIITRYLEPPIQRGMRRALSRAGRRSLPAQ